MKITALAGGVGGAKLLDGLAQVIPPENLVAIVNTGDDFEHFGLHISPDIDTVCYNLAGNSNIETGWGVKDETWNVLETITSLAGPDWFRIGDKDFATHLERTRRLKLNEPLSEVTRILCGRWGIKNTVLPMSDDPVRTVVSTDEGLLPFQEYFVKRHCEPLVCGFEFSGIESCQPAPGVIDAIYNADAVIICPSNPWVSIDPILKIPGISETLKKKVVVAVSPIICGKAIKGPLSKMFSELGIEASAFSVAEHYKGYLSGFIIDNQDYDQKKAIEERNVKVGCLDIIMNNRIDRRRLAEELLIFCKTMLKVTS